MILYQYLEKVGIGGAYLDPFYHWKLLIDFINSYALLALSFSSMETGEGESIICWKRIASAPVRMGVSFIGLAMIFLFKSQRIITVFYFVETIKMVSKVETVGSEGLPTVRYIDNEGGN